MWSTYGCEVVNSESEDDSGEGDVECRCNHTSNFAILMQIVPFKVTTPVSVPSWWFCSHQLLCHPDENRSFQGNHISVNVILVVVLAPVTLPSSS